MHKHINSNLAFTSATKSARLQYMKNVWGFTVVHMSVIIVIFRERYSSSELSQINIRIYAHNKIPINCPLTVFQDAFLYYVTLGQGWCWKGHIEERAHHTDLLRHQCTGGEVHICSCQRADREW